MIRVLLLFFSVSLFNTAYSDNASDIENILRLGGNTEIGNEFSKHQIQHFINIGENRLTIKCRGFHEYDCKDFAYEGARVIVGNFYTEYHVERIIESAATPEYVTVIADGFSNHHCDIFSRKGAAIDGWNSSDKNVYEIENHLEQGGQVHVSNEFSAYYIKRFIDTGGTRVTVNCEAFNDYYCKKFASAGAKIDLGSYYSAYSVQKIIKAARSPTNVEVQCIEFSSSNCEDFAKAGGKIYVGSDYSAWAVRGVIENASNKPNVIIKASGFRQSELQDFSKLGATIEN